jgi:hypothetical protein
MHNIKLIIFPGRVTEIISPYPMLKAVIKDKYMQSEIGFFSIIAKNSPKTKIVPKSEKIIHPADAKREKKLLKNSLKLITFTPSNNHLGSFA